MAGIGWLALATVPLALGQAQPQPAQTPDEEVIGGAAILHLPRGARLEVAVGCEAAWRSLGVVLKGLQS